MWGVLQMSFMKSPKIILFDLDGVILDTESLYLKLMLEYNEKMNLPITRDYYITNLLGKTKDNITYYLQRKFKNNFNADIYWDGIMKYREEYLEQNDIKLKNDFLRLKNYLKKNNYLFGIVTSNSIELVKKLLIKVGLNINEFEVIVTREDVEKPKPAPDLYLKAIKHFDVDKDYIIAIEDSNIGIQSALSAGINVINLEDIDIIDKDLKNNCMTISKSLDEVIDFLEEMRNRS